MASFDIFDIQLTDAFTGNAVITAGGMFQVCVAGTAHKATLADPDNGFAALGNPVSLTRGKLRFAVSTGVTGQAVPAVVDLYGISPKGHWVVRRNVAPGDPTEIPIDNNRRNELAVIPFAIADCTAGTEKDTGLILPSGVVVKPSPWVDVTTAAGQGSKTVSVGLLSTQSGGSATGFVNAISLTAIATVVTKLATTGTLGALLSETTTGAAAVIPVPYVVGATAINLSYTLTSAATLAEGFAMLAYELPFGS